MWSLHTVSEWTSLGFFLVLASSGLHYSIASSLQETGRDPDASRVFFTGLDDYDSLLEVEQRQFTHLIVAVFMRFENVHYQHQCGTIEEGLWARYESQMRFYVARRGALMVIMSSW